MMTVQEFHKRLKSIDKTDLKRKAVKQVEPKIIGLNRQQLVHGLNTDNQKIVPRYRSTAYAVMKRTMNPKAGFGTPDLKLSGKFHDSLKVLFGMDSFKIRGFTEYSEKLEKQYAKIYGLTKENFGKIQTAATQVFIKLWKQKLK